jgi:hypothetical protein
LSRYEEGISFLYSNFAFDLEGLPSARMFFACVPLHHLNQIQYLRISTVIIPRNYLSPSRSTAQNGSRSLQDLEEKEWVKVCETLRNMEGLKDLCISMLNTSNDRILEEEMLRPLIEVRVREEFVVEMPWSAREEVIDFGEREDARLFRVVRRERGLDPVIQVRQDGVEMTGWEKTRTFLLFMFCFPWFFLYYLAEWLVGTLVQRVRRAVRV